MLSINSGRQIYIRNDIDDLGNIIKTARKNNNLTRKQLAEKLNISARYLMSIENENRKPSYNVFLNLIHELGISANITAFPERQYSDQSVEQLIQLLYQCNERELKIAAAVIKALVDNK